MRIEIIGLFIILFSISCKSNRVEIKSKTISEQIDQLAQSKYTGNYKVIANDSNLHSLVTHKSKKFSELGFDIDFFIFDHETGMLIFEDFLKSGHVEWIDANLIKAVKREINDQGKREKEVYQYDTSNKRKTIVSGT